MANLGLRRLRKPKWLLVIGALFFLGMGTFRWSLWDSPPWLSVGDGQDAQQSTQGEGGSTGGFLPEEPNCIQNTVSAQPNDRYCIWNGTDSDDDRCKGMMMPLRSKSSYVFLGDSHMAHLAQHASTNWPFQPLNTTTRRHPCQNLAYYGLPPPNHDWLPPDASRGEGPISYGKEHPYCMDCRKCWNLLMDTPETTQSYLEYLVVEYARDVSLPTLITNTTQETAAYYLSRKPPSVCVASAGLNDAAIVPPISLDVYIKNVDKYLALLQRTCQNVVWIGIHAVVENESIPQTNCKLRKWNNAVIGQVSMRNYSNVYYIDIWDASLRTSHEGFLGLDKEFYDDLSLFFIHLMQG